MKTLSITMRTIKQTTIILLFIILSITVLWIRFLRERFPREIPYELTFIRFIILLSLILGCILSIYSLLTYKKTKYLVLDTLIKFFHRIYDIVWQSILTEKVRSVLNEYILPKLISSTVQKRLRTIILFTEFYPSLFLLVILVIDVFLFSKLYFIYKFVWVGLIILLFKCYLAILRTMLRSVINIVEQQSELYCYNLDYERFSHILEDQVLYPLPVEEFVTEETRRRECHCPPIIYLPIPQIVFMENMRIKLNLPVNATLKLDEFQLKIRQALAVGVEIRLILNHYERLNAKYLYYNIFRKFVYLIIWAYILFVSLPTLDFNFLDLFSFLSMESGNSLN
jgi:hypothetical protein